MTSREYREYREVKLVAGGVVGSAEIHYLFDHRTEVTFRGGPKQVTIVFPVGVIVTESLLNRIFADILDTKHRH